MQGTSSLVLLTGVLAACLTSGCLTYGGQRGTENIQDPGPISRIEIDIDAGSVDITSARGEVGARGAVASRWGEAAPEVLHYVSDGVLHVVGRCDSFNLACRTDVTLEVGPEVSVGVNTGQGTVRVTGLSGDVEVATDDGDIELYDVVGIVFVETGLGAVTGEGLAGKLIDARSEGGAIVLQVTAQPDRLVARTESGDIHLVVPNGAYRLQAEAPNGDLLLGNAVQNDATASSVIVARTQNGNVRIDGGPRSGLPTPQKPREETPPRRGQEPSTR
ncbi:MAG: DUF4097 family beta strand repeat-containing protein [Pseudomonadota bacterium]|nr:DUF4097 family beta strand repeat-containing protein [Pseudomonadota bacterium]